SLWARAHFDGRPVMPEVHEQRTTAEAFGAEAARYDRARPSYPPALVARVKAAGPGPSTLDVGCGTGIAARLFRDAGCQVLGVDVDARMATVARESGIECEVAKFEDWDPAGRTFDTLIAAQTWHWIDPAAGAAKAASVLRPGGLIALFWNAFEPPPDIRRAFRDVQSRHLPKAPSPWAFEGSIADGYARMVATAAAGLDRTGSFGPVEESRFEWDFTYSTEAWLDVLPTFGGLGSRVPPDLLRALLDDYAEVIDAVGGSFVMHYTTVAGTASRNS
ncbi:class I SAM-dependent methyltransferase, partial [Actinoplanes sp. NPDC051411]|uniref:class I SAM-dependent methyltransferase n=1 Tax=Actinoplanes sp. NPDC051411 TaxID=3155522 RepID=UPI00342B91DB